MNVDTPESDRWFEFIDRLIDRCQVPVEGAFCKVLGSNYVEEQYRETIHRLYFEIIEEFQNPDAPPHLQKLAWDKGLEEASRILTGRPQTHTPRTDVEDVTWKRLFHLVYRVLLPRLTPRQAIIFQMFWRDGHERTSIARTFRCTPEEIECELQTIWMAASQMPELTNE